MAAPHTPWDEAYAVGDATLDGQRQALLQQCNAMADALAQGCDEAAFRTLFAQMLLQAREHFASELAWLGDKGSDAAEALRAEQAEFEYLADDIITTDNFDGAEIQRFLVLWWVGHWMGLSR